MPNYVFIGPARLYHAKVVGTSPPGGVYPGES